MRTITAAQASAKWATVTPQRTGDYEEGVKNPRMPWAQASTNAADAYKAGVTEAVTRGAFAKGIAAAGDATYQKNTLAKGPQRFAEGVQMAQDLYATKMAPVLKIIETTTLPPRFAKGDPRNIERVKVLAAALRKGRTG